MPSQKGCFLLLFESFYLFILKIILSNFGVNRLFLDTLLRPVYTGDFCAIFVAAIRCNFCRAQVASSNRMCKRAAISVRFRRDFSPRLECKLMQTTKIAVILISGFATEQDV